MVHIKKKKSLKKIKTPSLVPWTPLVIAQPLPVKAMVTEVTVPSGWSFSPHSCLVQAKVIRHTPSGPSEGSSPFPNSCRAPETIRKASLHQFCSNYRKFGVSFRPNRISTAKNTNTRSSIPSSPDYTVSVPWAGLAPPNHMLGAGQKKMGNEHWVDNQKLSTIVSMLSLQNWDNFFSNFS